AQRLARDLADRLGVEDQTDPLQREHLLVLLDQRVLRLREDLDEGILVERVERHHRRETADQLRDHTESNQVVRLDPIEPTRLVDAQRLALTRKADPLRTTASIDDLVQAIEGATADEEDVARVDL